MTLCCLQGDEAMVLKLWTLEPVLLSVSLQSLWFINLQIKNKNKKTPSNHSLNRFLFKRFALARLQSLLKRLFDLFFVFQLNFPRRTTHVGSN